MRAVKFSDRLGSRLRRFFSRSNRLILLELARVNLKGGDYGSLLGGLWSLSGLSATLVVMYFVFSKRFGSDVRAYPLYLLLGILPVSFFVTTTTHMVKVFFVNRDVALNSTILRESLVLTSMSLHAYRLTFELLLCVVISLLYGFFTWKSVLLIVPLLAAFLAFVLGVGLIVSLLYCFARDIEYVWTLASRLLFFATPVFYTPESMSLAARRLIYFLNPLAPFLTAFRAVFIDGGQVSAFVYGHCLLLGVVVFSAGYMTFLGLEGAAMERA
ncbi:MAG: ABC transporter permease [Candidatus Eisenbacteria bacterium]|nr:ABC transporter permease [Candidatus Eisenbacteria bacterium]